MICYNQSIISLCLYTYERSNNTMATKKRKKQFEVDNKKKIIKANVEKLTPAELQAVNNYLGIGYTLDIGTIKQKSKGIYTKENINKFLKDKGYKFDIKAYSEELNEEGKKKGFIHAQRQFRKQYQDEFLEYLGK